MEKIPKLEFHKKVVDTTYNMANSIFVYMIQNKPSGYCSSERYTSLFSLLIVVNNIFARRGSRDNKIKDIRKNLSDKFDSLRWGDTPYRVYLSQFSEKSVGEKIYQLLLECENITLDNYNELALKVKLAIQYLDSVHFDWKIDDNIVYDKNPYTRTIRTFSLMIHDKNQFEKWKSLYNNIIDVTSDETLNITTEIVYDFYTTLENVINSLVRKDYEDAKDTLDDYLNNSDEMNRCVDIYIRKNYKNLFEVKKSIDKGFYSKANQQLRVIIESESYKFRKYKFTLFKLLQVNMRNDNYQISLDKAIEDFEKYTKKYMTS